MTDEPIVLDVDPKASPLYKFLGHLPSKDVEHWWDEDNYKPILPIDLAIQAVYGYSAWRNWLELGRPDKFTIVWKTDDSV